MNHCCLLWPIAGGFHIDEKWNVINTNAAHILSKFDTLGVFLTKLLRFSDIYFIIVSYCGFYSFSFQYFDLDYGLCANRAKKIDSDKRLTLSSFWGRFSFFFLLIWSGRIFEINPMMIPIEFMIFLYHSSDIWQWRIFAYVVFISFYCFRLLKLFQDYLIICNRKSQKMSSTLNDEPLLNFRSVHPFFFELIVWY